MTSSSISSSSATSATAVLLAVVILVLRLSTPVSSHGAMTYPRPRNAVDGTIEPWTDWSYPCDAMHKGSNCSITFCETGHNCQGSCPITARKAGHPEALNASNGQACYWFSNGCTVGCDACDGTNNHYGHGGQRFRYNNMTAAELHKANITIDPWAPSSGLMVLDPTTTKSLDPKPNCEKPSPFIKPTICNSSLRTVNTQAECGTVADFYRFSPWRHPGAAPVIDSCGSAGGRFPGQGTGPAGAQFENSSVAKAGDVGSKLPAMPPSATWKRGSGVQVSWTVMANHGGGYAYRLAPARARLTEDVFQRTPLRFVGTAALRWGGDPTSDLVYDPEAKGWQTEKGTTPRGSTWRKVPIPTVLWEREGPSFEPLCNESKACRDIASWQHAYDATAGTCKCSGHSNGGPLLPNVEMVDTVQLPSDLVPGAYVLQFRWDCEETDQIWTSCADVEITL